LTEFEAIISELRSRSDPEKAKSLSRYFKTGPGEYGEGDRFLGLAVPQVRKVAKAHPHASKRDISKLLSSAYHEERFTALLIMVEQYRRGDERTKKHIFDLYLASTSRINNWDLVDLTAPHIVGSYLFERDRLVLMNLALSKNLWERRISILSTAYFIQRGESEETLRISKLLLHDPHDLIHKAVGWMLREVGNRCSPAAERRFLDKHVSTMPRTMLRYAIERFPADLRSHYMQAGKSFTAKSQRALRSARN
jgi:3-methyladenine DNA glycosylase AlkD